MIEITYVNDLTDKFDIYSETDTHITWKDYARNFIRINKHSNKVSLLIDNTWVEYDLRIKSYKKL